MCGAESRGHYFCFAVWVHALLGLGVGLIPREEALPMGSPNMRRRGADEEYRLRAALTRLCTAFFAVFIVIPCHGSMIGQRLQTFCESSQRLG